MRNLFWSEMVGELLGTFILVLLGCGSVGVTVLFSAHTGLFQVAAVWGIGVALAIYATRHLSCAHLNPTVSLAMVIAGRMLPQKLFFYLCGQLAGAFLAAALLFAMLGGSIAHYEQSHGIHRGSSESVQTAMIFGEYYPNPGAGADAAVDMQGAILAEAIGTLVLVLLIFCLTDGCNLGRPDDSLAPLFIGLSVTVLISILAPLTQAGLNPARDLAPRLFAWLAGWGPAAFPDRSGGFLKVYVLAPLAGGALAALVFRWLIVPLMRRRASPGECGCISRQR